MRTRADDACRGVQIPVVAVSLNQIVRERAQVDRTALQRKIGVAAADAYHVQIAGVGRICTATADGDAVISTGRARHVEEVDTAGGEIGTHDERTVAGQVADRQGVELIHITELDCPPIHRQRRDITITHHGPGGIAIDRQALDILQVPGECRKIFQLHRGGAASLDDHIALQLAVTHEQVGQPPTLDFKQGVVTGSQGGVVAHFDIGGGRTDIETIDEDCRTVLSGDARLVVQYQCAGGRDLRVEHHQHPVLAATD